MTACWHIAVVKVPAGGLVMLLWICAQIASVSPSVGPMRVVSVLTNGMVVQLPEASAIAV